jgi:hypothetical protein
MRIGRFARSVGWLAPVAAVVLITAVPASTFGQAPPPNGGGGLIDPYGNASGAPSGYGGQWHEGWGGPQEPSMPGGFTGPLPMGAGGTDPPHGYDLMNDVGVEGFLVDQRGPHYFDIRAEAVYLQRDETFSRDIDFTSRDIGPPLGAGEIVLSSGDLDFDRELGFRVLGRYDIDPLAVFEFGYTGIFGYETSATATSDQNELFSLFSQFGNNPVTVGLAGGPMVQTERGSRQSISMESDLQSAELSYRRYWVGWIPRVSGTLLAGFRYTKMNESFSFNTVGSTLEPPGGPPATLDYHLDADNNLAGFQAGGDMWIGLIQGLRLGGEGKVGLYNNHYTLTNRINEFPAVAVPGPLDPAVPDILFEPERFRDNQPAMIAEASVDLVADILPSWSLRVGYEVLFINSVVLAGDNFNTASPFGLPGQAARVPFVDDQNDLFYHGGHAGLEYIW